MLALPSFHPLLLLDYPPESFLYEARNVRGHKLFFVCEPLPRFKEHGLGCLFSSKVGHSCSRLESETSRCSPLQVLMGAEMSPKKNPVPLPHIKAQLELLPITRRLKMQLLDAAVPFCRAQSKHCRALGVLHYPGLG